MNILLYRSVEEIECLDSNNESYMLTIFYHAIVDRGDAVVKLIGLVLCLWQLGHNLTWGKHDAREWITSKYWGFGQLMARGPHHLYQVAMTCCFVNLKQPRWVVPLNLGIASWGCFTSCFEFEIFLRPNCLKPWNALCGTWFFLFAKRPMALAQQLGGLEESSTI